MSNLASCSTYQEQRVL